MKRLLITLFVLIGSGSIAQTIETTLAVAMKKLQADPQFKHAVLSLYVADANGKILFDKNAETGMVPASCQKVITSVTAFEILGKEYRFKTSLAYDGTITNGTLNGNVYITGFGDPTLGSWRWNSTKEDAVLKQFVDVIDKAGIKKINGKIWGYDKKWESNTTPSGWVWEDIGNYYGAGASALNWRENQYDLLLKPGKNAGEKVSITGMKPPLHNVSLSSELVTGEKGSGDNAYIFLAPYSNAGFVRGSIPPGENNFTISGAMPDPASELANILADQLKEKGIDGILFAGSFNGKAIDKKDVPVSLKELLSIQSPSLDSINYWFLKKSVNLYGEAFVKAIAFDKEQFGSANTGIAIIKQYWSKKGIEPSAINMKDGSGLAPSNRITAKSLVTVLQYARQQQWFPSFYNALPEMNGIKMKDGYIGGVRSYTGYIKSSNGNVYTFAFIANNFDGSPSTVREKMWKLMDILK